MAVELLCRHFITLFLIVVFTMKLWRQRGSTDHSLRYHWMTVISTALLIVADSMELWALQDPSRRFWRILFSVIGYSMRPTAALSILLIVWPKTRRPIWIWLPSTANTLIFCTAFFSTIAFGYSDEYHFIRGPMGYTAHVISFMYIAIAVVMTWVNYRNKVRTRERYVLYVCAAACIIAALIDTSAETATLDAVIMITSIFLYFFLRSIDMNRDPLTMLLNRMSFYDDCERFGASISAVASLDMNGLKYLNDSKGHAAGDEALRTIGMNLQEIRNNRILPYRIGGDEFMILFIHQDEDAVAQVLKDLKQRIQAKGYYISTGYAMRGLSSASMQDLIRWADEKMYAEKAQFYSQNSHDRRRSRV